MSGPRRSDVLVVGAGPAAWATALACRRAGLDTALVAPDPLAAWPQTIGSWQDDLDDTGWDVPLRHRWAKVHVVGERAHVIDRAYGLVDCDAWLTSMHAEFAGGGGHVVVGRAAGVHPDGSGSTVLLSDRRSLTAAVVVDASGHEPVLVRVTDRRPVAAQVAYGIVARFDGPPAAPGACTLMDWSWVPAGERSPSFLYALDLGDGWWLVEETSLAARPPLAPALLERRLGERLAARGVTVIERDSVEVVRIPMARPLPDRGRVIGTGAAGGLVHPATGYSVAASLRAATRLAPALADAVLVRGATPAALASLGHRAVWPAALERSRSLFRFGLEAVLGFDQGECRAFFDAFFGLPEPLWRSYLAGTDGPRDVARTMRTLFAAAPPPLRRKLAGGNPLALMAAVR